MFEKHLWKSDILSKDAGRWPINRTLVGNGLMTEQNNLAFNIFFTLQITLCNML